MTEQHRGTIKLNPMESWLSLLLSSTLILGSIAALIIWALQSAYNL